GARRRQPRRRVTGPVANVVDTDGGTESIEPRRVLVESVADEQRAGFLGYTAELDAVWITVLERCVVRDDRNVLCGICAQFIFPTFCRPVREQCWQQWARRGRGEIPGIRHRKIVLLDIEVRNGEVEFVV